ncbi:hypothetical protein MSAR_15620 [Mycolicibacterium sarraceniae]|uniref:Uncharacterized protein n=1 Tax=Mycolicibacterium sarraceniae TaxID=1534348 RepID=A0A7I7SRJ6_9MYCO|nr:hypothetical protein MSAR_15620 [Mycolicibacterium sarraceniae]
MVEVGVEHIGRDVPSGGEVFIGVVHQTQRSQCPTNFDDGTAAVTAAQDITSAAPVPGGIAPGTVAKTRHAGPFGHHCQRASEALTIAHRLGGILSEACRIPENGRRSRL